MTASEPSTVIEPEWPDVAVLIPTFNRPIILVQTVRALQKWLVYPGNVRYYVGVAGDPQVIEVLQRAFATPPTTLLCPTGGLGANLNLLLQATHESLILQLDDDHLLTHHLDLKPHARELLDHPAAGWVRLMGIGSHHYTATLRDQYWYVNWYSAELYIPSNRPHLKHRRFLTTYGYYTPGLKLGLTEEIYCHQCIDLGRALGDKAIYVTVPLNSESETIWEHVGASWQLKGY